MLPRVSSNYAKIFLAFFAYPMSMFNQVCIKEPRHLDLNGVVTLGTVTLLSSFTHMGKKNLLIQNDIYHPFLKTSQNPFLYTFLGTLNPWSYVKHFPLAFILLPKWS